MIACVLLVSIEQQQIACAPFRESDWSAVLVVYARIQLLKLTLAVLLQHLASRLLPWLLLGTVAAVVIVCTSDTDRRSGTLNRKLLDKLAGVVPWAGYRACAGEL